MSDTSYELYMMRGPSPGSIFALSDRGLTIGRDPLSDILINDPEVSRQHALLIHTPTGDFRIQDLGSTNGTYVDGERVGSKPMALRPSNAITMGGTVTLVFRERSAIQQPEPEEEEEIDAQTSEDSAPDSIQPVSSMPGPERQGVQDSPAQGIELEEIDRPIKQPREEVSKATPSHLPAQQPAAINPDDAIPGPSEIGIDEPEGLSPNLILGSVLLLLCCCATIFAFLVYSGGDSLLRQLGVVP